MSVIITLIGGIIKMIVIIIIIYGVGSVLLSKGTGNGGFRVLGFRGFFQLCQLSARGNREMNQIWLYKS